ncbi:MAG: hypothetical protein NWQ06_06690 [Leeuwenhoekiella sp.]|nr:hypothetical protein [Leeuwenhoekiella sp.]
MILRYLVLAVFIILVGCKEKPDSAPASNTVTEEDVAEETVFTIEEIYGFAQAGTLENKYAEDDLLETKNWIEESSIEVVTLKIYPNTPKELLVHYTDINKTAVHSIEAYAYDSPWKSETDIYMGMPLAKLETLNKKAIRFSGYEWDFAGAVDFQQGALSSKTLFVYLGTDGDVAMPKEFVGSDVKITSEQAKDYDIEFKVTGLLYRPNK